MSRRQRCTLGNLCLLGHAPSAEQLANPETCRCPANGCPHPDLTGTPTWEGMGKEVKGTPRLEQATLWATIRVPPLVDSPLENVMIDPLHLLLGLI